MAGILTYEKNSDYLRRINRSTVYQPITNPLFCEKNIFLTTCNLKGVVTYGKSKTEIQRLCREDSSRWVSTLIDYYRFPKDFSAYNQYQNKSSYERAQLLEKEFQTDINEPNFIAHLNIHEFEALLFSDTQAFEKTFNNEASISIDTINKQYILLNTSMMDLLPHPQNDLNLFALSMTKSFVDH